MSGQQTYQKSRDEQRAWARRRAHANIEAMQNLIIQRITEETDVMMPPKVRAFISALQSAHGGGEVIHQPFKRSHLRIAQYLQFTGTEVAKEARVRRLIKGLEDYQQQTGVMLFHIKRGGDLVIAPDGTQTHTVTEYTDMFKPIADAAVARARGTELWKGSLSKNLKAHPGNAMAAQVDWAMSQLVRFNPEAETEPEPMELRDYAETQLGRLEKSASKVAGEIESKGGNGSVWLRRLAKDLLREAELMDKPEVAQESPDGVTILLPCDVLPENDGVTKLLPCEAENLRNTEENPNILAAALAYAARGKPVFPVRPDKSPYTPNGFKDATTDEQTIRAWWRKWPDANIGVPTGEASGRLVLDIDPRHGGDAPLTELIEKHGDFPDTLAAKTGGDGLHIIFAYPKGSNIRNSAGKLGEGVDVRGEGGYIIVAPSLHASGKHYQWLNDCEPAPMPDWLLKLLTEEKQPTHTDTFTNKTRSQAKSAAAIEGLIPEHERNDTLFRRVACSLRGKGAGYDEILSALIDARDNHCALGSHPVPDSELQKIAKSAMRYQPNSAKAMSAGVV